MNPVLVLSAASLILCGLFFFYFRWYIKRRTAAEELLAEYRAEVYRLIAEIDSATDRDALLVEERIRTLKALLEDTDKRIAVYVRELERSRAGEALYTRLGRGIRSALEPQAASPEAREAPEPAAPPAPEPVPVKQRLRVQIAELSASGLSPADIASRLNISPSEVNLALNLLGH
jgi:DNA-binding NarL/FixJ family response regulator